MQPENSPEFITVDRLFAGIGYPTAMERLYESSLISMESNQRGNGRASENHKEAERKRRQRINGHLDRLRDLLLCSSKTDKASLLAKVVERVRELKQQASEIVELDQSFPTESDEITVLQTEDEGTSLLKASMCCDDRIDLIPELINILKSFSLTLSRAEMVTLGGRVKNVMVLVGDKNQTNESVLLLRDALKALVVRSNGRVGDERLKRQRMFLG